MTNRAAGQSHLIILKRLSWFIFACISIWTAASIQVNIYYRNEICALYLYGLFSKGASKMGYFSVIDKNDISLCKLGNIFILSNSKQTKEAGRAFKSKYDHLI